MPKNGNLFEIVPRQAYANVYEMVRDRAEQEQEQDARPAIKNEIKTFCNTIRFMSVIPSDLRTTI